MSIAETVLDLTRARRPEGDLLERVALALNSTLELREVLRLLAEISLEASGADRCSLFLLVDRRLRPAVAIGTRSDEDLWEAFRQMGPVDLERVPSGWSRFLEGRAVAVEDAATCDLIPPEWVERFRLRSLVLVPLLAAGEPCGLMVVDYPTARFFSDAEIRVLEAIGSYAGIAVRNARLFDATRRRARLQEALFRGAQALASPFDPPVIARRLVDAYFDLLGARLCAIGLFDTDRARITTVASRGTRKLRGPLAVSEIPDHIVSRLWREWSNDKRPIEFQDDPWLSDFVGGQKAGASWYLVIPLVVEGHSRGAVLLGFGADTSLDADERSAAEALAAIAAAALERTALLDRLGRQLSKLEVLYGLSAALTDGADARALIARLNDLLSGHGVRVVSLAFRDRTLARRLGGDDPTDAERASWRSGNGCVALPDGSLAVPMRLGRRLVGTLRVSPAELQAEERSFLEALGRGVAEVANRGALRATVEEAARERAVSGERERIAADLHDSVGQLFVATGLLARRQVEELPADSPWVGRILRLADLADSGKWEIDQAIRALAFFPGNGRGLSPSIRALARSFEGDSGIPVLVGVSGRPVRLSPRVERALYRVAHEALANAWRHARCDAIRVDIEFADDITLRVVDDGVGMGRRLADEGLHVGIGSMRRAVEDVGGTFKIKHARPRGTVVQATVRREVR